MKKLYSPLILIISLILLFYTFYRSEIIWNGDKRNYYFTYYIISFLLILFSIITFYLNKKIKEYLIISTFSIFFALYFAESYLTYLEYTEERIKIYERETGKKWDTRSHIEYYKDLKKIDNSAKLRVFPESFINDNNLFPVSGISNSKTVYNNENGYYFVYDSDRYGFNNPDEEWDQNKIEYLLIGDSFAQGANVNRPNDIASVLRDLSNKSVLTLGYGGNGPLIEYASLKEYLNPTMNKVLWLYYERNDPSNLVTELTNKILRKYLDNFTFTQNLKSRQDEIDKLAEKKMLEEMERFIYNNRFSYKFKKFIKLYNLRLSLAPKSKKINLQPEFKKILKFAKILTEKNNSKLYFVYLPTYSRYLKNYENTDYILIKEILNELNISFIDLHTEVFDRAEDPFIYFPFKLPGHYNLDGYKKVAEKIYDLTNN